MTAVSEDPDDSGFDNIDPELLKSLATQASRQNLEPLEPQEALQAYEQLREDDVTDSTMRSHKSRIQFFIDWCEDTGINNLNDLSGRDLQDYRSHRKGGLTLSSLETNMRTLRTFLRKCVKLDAVPVDLPEKVEVPSVSSADNSRDDEVTAEQAEAILKYLDKYLYGTVEHVVWLLMTSAGLRIGALRSLDVRDYTSLPDGAELELHHRPASETRLKNKEASQRVIHVSEYVRDVIDDFLADQRPDVTDDYGREPLLASDHGRTTQATIRKYAYKWTRPCITEGECPHGESMEGQSMCEAMKTGSDAYKCPSSLSPHAVRRGYISAELNVGVPKQVVGDRCDVSPDIIDEHYDTRSEQEKMRLRKEIRESTYGDKEDTGYGQ